MTAIMLDQQKVSVLLLTPGGHLSLHHHFQSGLDISKSAHSHVLAREALGPRVGRVSEMQARHHPAFLLGPQKQWLFFPFAFGGGLSGGQCQDGNQPSSPTCGPVLGALRAFSGKKGTGEAGRQLGAGRAHTGQESRQATSRLCVQGTPVTLSVRWFLVCEQEFKRYPRHRVDGAVALLVTGRNGKDWDNLSTEGKWP